MDLQPGNVIDNRYVVEAEIGRGGMAAVYRVRHAQLGTLAALKVLTMPAASIQERLLHEGRVQAALQHPNIVTVSDVVIHNGAPGLVMEYVRGPSLDDFLVKRRMSFGQADEIAQGVLAGVRAAHNHGLIHRDLKPANIMLAITDSGLIPKVADFGLVKMLEGDAPSMSKTRSGVAMGTPAYMAPEQISDAKNVDYRADIFSLGAILYELVTNVRAFDHDDMFQTFSAIMSAQYTPLRELKPDIPERMERAILGALHTDREQRIQTVADLLAIWKGEMDADGARTASTSLWDADFLSEVSSMGAGGETSAESLRRSMRSGMNDLPGRTAAPHSGDQETRIPDMGSTQQTMAPIPGMFEDEMPASAQQPHPGQVPIAGRPAAYVPPSEPPSPPAVVEQPITNDGGNNGAIAVVGMVGVGLFLLMLGGTAVGAWSFGVFDKPDPITTTLQPDPLPVPDPVPTVPEPTPDPVPEPVPEPMPAPVPVPTPVTQPTAPVVPTPVPQPVPVVPQPDPVQPEPQVPAPEPVVPVPVVQPPPEPPPAPAGPKVYFNGQGATIQLLDGNGMNVPPSKVVAGNTYEIRALWSPSVPSAVIKAAQVFEMGKHYEIRCAPAKQICIVREE